MTESEKLELFNWVIAKIKATTFRLPDAFETYLTPFDSATSAISSFVGDGELLKLRTPEILAAKVLLDSKIGLFNLDTLVTGKKLVDHFFAAAAIMGDAATQLFDCQRTHVTMTLEPFIALANSSEMPFDFRQFGVPRYPEYAFVTRAIDNALSPRCESASLLEFLRVRDAQIVVPEKAASVLASLLHKKTPELLNCFIKAGLLTHITDGQLQEILVTALLQSQGILNASASPFASAALFEEDHHSNTAYLQRLQALLTHFSALNKEEVCARAIVTTIANSLWPNRPEVIQILAAYAPKALLAALLLAARPDRLASFVEAGLLTDIKPLEYTDILRTALLETQGITADRPFYSLPEPVLPEHIENLRRLMGNFSVLPIDHSCLQSLRLVTAFPYWPDESSEISAALKLYKRKPLEITSHPQTGARSQTIFASSSGTSSAAGGSAPIEHTP